MYVCTKDSNMCKDTESNFCWIKSTLVQLLLQQTFMRCCQTLDWWGGYMLWGTNNFGAGQSPTKTVKRQPNLDHTYKTHGRMQWPTLSRLRGSCFHGNNFSSKWVLFKFGPVLLNQAFLWWFYKLFHCIPHSKKHTLAKFGENWASCSLKRPAPKFRKR